MTRQRQSTSLKVKPVIVHKEVMYFYLSSLQSLLTHPSNKSTDFTIDLKEPIVLQHPEEWEVAIVELDAPFFTRGSTDAAHYYILSDIVDSSAVGGAYYPVLRKRTPPPSGAVTGVVTGALYNPGGMMERTLDLVLAQGAVGDREIIDFTNPLYVTVRQSNLEQIRIYMRSLNFEDMDDTGLPTYMTLHLRKKALNRGRFL